MRELNMFEWGMCIGQKVRFVGTNNTIEGILHQINLNGGLKFLNIKRRFNPLLCKPILRTLDMITDEEKKEFSEKFIYESWKNKYKETFSGIVFHELGFELLMTAISGSLPSHNISCSYSVNQIDWLRSKGFCLNPEWIDKGLAIREGKE